MCLDHATRDVHSLVGYYFPFPVATLFSAAVEGTGAIEVAVLDEVAPRGAPAVE